MSTTRRWGIGAAIAALVILAAGWFLLVKPQKSKVNDLHQQAAAQQATNQQLTTKIAALQAEAKNHAQEQRILDKFATQIPDTAGEPSLIRALSQAAKGSGVDLVKIAPAEATAAGGSSAASGTIGAAPTAGALYALPMQLTVTGVYANLESFFSAIEHLPRAFLVSDFKMGPATDDQTGDLPANALQATIDTSVFFSTPSTTTGTATSSTAAPGASSTTNPAAPAADPARNAAGETS